MSAIPVLMVLYSSNAVEIRYSDGSRLEVSPCGSTIIHHNAPDHSKHPRHDHVKKGQKRTRFVTSEHRHKVLQALDFRNRFAERPYLCEDLLPKEDILALYATIDRIAWPKLPEKAKVEVLPDGSRRVTSLDEFASLIVSPHGHDFTVCYLSRLSEDKNKSKGSLHKVPDSARSNTASLSSGSHMSQGERPSHCHKLANTLGSRPNEAVVHPFTTADHAKEIQAGGSTVVTGHPQHDQNFSYVQTHLQGLTATNWGLEQHENVEATNFAKPLEQGLSSQSQRSSHGGLHGATENAENRTVKQSMQAQNMNESEKSERVHQHAPSDKLQAAQSQRSEGETCGTQPHPTAPPQSKDTCIANNTEGVKRSSPSMPFVTGSPTSHELSSISRSSTPDGLRTTIDSDATLTQDITDNSQRKVLVYKQRHSSPTQYTSSPYEAQLEQGPMMQGRSEYNADTSLSGSFLGDKEQCVLTSPSKYADGLNTVIHPPSTEDKSHSSTMQNSSGTMSADSLELEKTAGHSSLVKKSSDKSNNAGSCRLTASLDAGKDDFSHTAQAETVQRDTVSSPRHIVSAKEVSANQAPSTVMTEKSSDLFELQKNEHEGEGQCRHCYVWTTKHASRNECPLEWTHPLKLALEGKTLTNDDISSHPTLTRLQAVSTTFKPNEKKCSFTTVPSPLPVTCPFQHKHKWTSSGYHDDTLDEKSDVSVGEFQHGRLKIVISEGVVYRLIHRDNLNVMEIHPGDGSILVSQGVKGHFFTHYLLTGDQLEERTYSLKSLPPGRQKGRYSIERLIKTANRFLMMNEQWRRRGLREDTPCWKKEVIAVVEPLSSSLLEECFVEGLGKFSAFTNGRVRIVFEDRAALDMVCNFSRRVSECMQHSQDPQLSLPCASTVAPPVPTIENIFGASTGRLLLPSGKYVTVDISNPGLYRKYVQAGQEWAAWVNSTPMERQQFYTQHHMPSIMKQAAEIELKKIFCFNYVLEQTTLLQQQSHDKVVTSGSQGTHDSHIPSPANIAGSHTPRYTVPQFIEENTAFSQHHLPKTTVPATLDQEGSKFYAGHLSSQKVAAPNGDQNFHSIQEYYSRDQDNFYQAHGSSAGVSGWARKLEAVSDKKKNETIQGFQSVRHVLLQNSNLINDIDNFLETTKKS